MSTTERLPNFTHESEPEPEPEPEPELPPGIVPPPLNFDSYHEEWRRNSLIDRIVVFKNGSTEYRVFILSENAGDNSGEIHIDVKGRYIGQLDQAGKELFLEKLRAARRL